jgi:hypothetical protein
MDDDAFGGEASRCETIERMKGVHPSDRADRGVRAKHESSAPSVDLGYFAVRAGLVSPSDRPRRNRPDQGMDERGALSPVPVVEGFADHPDPALVVSVSDLQPDRPDGYMQSLHEGGFMTSGAGSMGTAGDLDRLSSIPFMRVS